MTLSLKNKIVNADENGNCPFVSFSLVSVAVGPMFFGSTAAHAQVRGGYPVGMNARTELP